MNPLVATAWSPFPYFILGLSPSILLLIAAAFLWLAYSVNRGALAARERELELWTMLLGEREKHRGALVREAAAHERARELRMILLRDHEEHGVKGEGQATNSGGIIRVVAGNGVTLNVTVNVTNSATFSPPSAPPTFNL
jgi:hypothetical protein